MEYNNDFKYDLKVGKIYEHKLAALLGNKIEVKRDFKCLDTGNIFVEYESRGKKSGISTTEAEWWCYWLSDYHFFMVETERLKTICRNYLNTRRDTVGGDSNTSKGILVPLKLFFENKY